MTDLERVKAYIMAMCDISSDNLLEQLDAHLKEDAETEAQLLYDADERNRLENELAELREAVKAYLWEEPPSPFAGSGFDRLRQLIEEKP